MDNLREMVVLPHDLVNEDSATIMQTDISNENLNNSNQVNQNRTVKNNTMVKREIGGMKKRQSNILKIALILANKRAYNDKLQIKRRDGSFNQDSDLIKLLGLTQNKVKNITGLYDFIQQLQASKIDPDLILNENIKDKLIAFKDKQPKPLINRKINKAKRALNIDLDESTSKFNKKSKKLMNRNSWEIPFTESEEN